MTAPARMHSHIFHSCLGLVGSAQNEQPQALTPYFQCLNKPPRSRESWERWNLLPYEQTLEGNAITQAIKQQTLNANEFARLHTQCFRTCTPVFTALYAVLLQLMHAI